MKEAVIFQILEVIIMEINLFTCNQVALSSHYKTKFKK